MRASLLGAFSLGSLCVVAVAAGAGCQTEKEVIRDGDDVVIAEVPPPPLSGGTLIVSSIGARAIAADPDRDAVWVVDLAGETLEHAIQLEAGDEPGRLVEDGAGLVHVALRSAGALVTIDPAAGTIVRRTPICAGPRGLAFDAAAGQLHVACGDGQLVTLDPATGSELRRLALDTDLRDIVVQGDRLLVTRFRSAEILSIDASGAVVSRALPATATLPSFSDFDGTEKEAHFTPDVAWRAVRWPSGGMLMVHQRAKVEEIELDTPGGYGEDGCGSIVHGALTQVGVADNGTLLPPVDAMTRLPAVLPVDVAVSADGTQIAVAAAGSQQVFLSYDYDLQVPAAESCGLFGSFVSGMPVAVAFHGNELVTQIREPAAIELPNSGVRIGLPGKSVRDTGYDLFHLPPGTFPGHSTSGFDREMGDVAEPGFAGGGTTLACASCHPEAGDDSHVWSFQGIGARRTQTMRGGVLETLPLHWDGDMEDVSAIMGEVFSRRMGGPEAGPTRSLAIEHWIGELPAPPRMRSPEDPAAARGKALFESDAVGCAKCHSGAHLTNNENASVGKGESLQVPSLVGVAWRAPFMHDGCAQTLADRFDPACGGTQHGDVSGLTEADLADLVAYLESL